MSEPRVITLVPRVPTHRLEAFLREDRLRKYPARAKVVAMEIERRKATGEWRKAA